MDASEITRRVISALPADVSQKLAGVEVFVRPVPTAGDLARGATPTHRGYFYGFAPEPITSTEIPDQTPASGELVIFSDAHSTALELERTILHEIAHVLGCSEEEISTQMGLGS